jgi:hypothetical protein
VVGGRCKNQRGIARITVVGGQRAEGVQEAVGGKQDVGDLLNVL